MQWLAESGWYDCSTWVKLLSHGKELVKAFRMLQVVMSGLVYPILADSVWGNGALVACAWTLRPLLVFVGSMRTFHHSDTYFCSWFPLLCRQKASLPMKDLALSNPSR